MKSKLKIMAISFIMMMVAYFTLSNSLWIYGMENSHVGALFVLGLLFGPYGALGAVLANTILDIINGYHPLVIITSEIISFGVSYLAYKIWYSGFKTEKITKPNLDNTYHLSLFLLSIFICGLVYSSVHGHLLGITINTDLDEYFFMSYLLNFINISFIFGIPAIWLSKKIDFIPTPKKSGKPVNRKLYRILFTLLLLVTIISSANLLLPFDRNIMIVEIALIGILLYAYLTKPFEYDIQPNDENTMIEKIIENFLIITLAIAIIGMIISFLSYNLVKTMNINIYLELMPILVITDAIIILFFVPGIIIMRYIETKVIQPISSFSEIERFITENEKIEAEGLVNVYSKYVNEQNEIGTLARSYTELIEHNNNYIENIQKIEGEKERINTELDIATRIQASALPTEALESDNFIVNGYSHPAKEVGGDFFDYYMLDEDNLAIVIGDASGKGVPAAIIAMITQVMIKQILKHTKKPSDVLYLLNNQLCENNPESMFITLWLGIFNRKTKKLTFSNAGHNPPLIKKVDNFRFLELESGIVLGVMEDFVYTDEELILTDELVIYTDGITDANNTHNEMYGEERLLNFFNEFKNDDDPILPLLDNIHSFTEDAVQFDDMTLAYIKIK
ncbi:PP2C family protein-serine/threonine phosphatase [Methanobrevibacter sp.]